MPLEIKELHIKGVIENGSGQQSSKGPVSDEEKQALIAAAVERVLQILEEKKQR